MPHILVKIVGKTEQEKAKLASDITNAVVASIGANEANVTVNIEDIEKEDWVEKVYKPDIARHWERLYKKPSYYPYKIYR